VRVAQRPDGLASLIDSLPRRFRFDAKRDQFLCDCLLAFPLLELNRAQSSPYVRVQWAECVLDAIGADAEVKWTPNFGPVDKVVNGACSKEGSSHHERPSKTIQCRVQGEGRA
jgi:hypothetical protein